MSKQLLRCVVVVVSYFSSVLFMISNFSLFLNCWLKAENISLTLIPTSATISPIKSAKCFGFFFFIWMQLWISIRFREKWRKKKWKTRKRKLSNAVNCEMLQQCILLHCVRNRTRRRDDFNIYDFISVLYYLCRHWFNSINCWLDAMQARWGEKKAALFLLSILAYHSS